MSGNVGRLADAEKELRSAIRQRVEVADGHYSDDTRATADKCIELAIGRLVLAALQIGRRNPFDGAPGNA